MSHLKDVRGRIKDLYKEKKFQAAADLFSEYDALVLQEDLSLNFIMALIALELNWNEKAADLLSALLDFERSGKSSYFGDFIPLLLSFSYAAMGNMVEGKHVRDFIEGKEPLIPVPVGRYDVSVEFLDAVLDGKIILAPQR